MRIFVSEYLAGGASAGSTVASTMRREGYLMLQAVTADLAQLPGCSVLTTLDASLDTLPEIDVISVESPEEEGAVFTQLLNEVDAVLVIAPETDEILLQRCHTVLAAGVASWNCSPAAIELCGDKLRLSEHLLSNGILTIPTRPCHPENDPRPMFKFPMVVKPRDGAGSCQTFRIDNLQDWDRTVKAFRDAGASRTGICQPYVSGKALSVGVTISLDGQRMECLPVGEQILSSDGQFKYLGGRIPADISAHASTKIINMVQAACRTVNGLAGYLGVDVILDDDGQPWLVEINPRLTTSYVGYRQILNGSIPQTWLSGPTRAIAGTKLQSIEFRSHE